MGTKVYGAPEVEAWPTRNSYKKSSWPQTPTFVLERLPRPSLIDGTVHVFEGSTINIHPSSDSTASKQLIWTVSLGSMKASPQ